MEQKIPVMAFIHAAFLKEEVDLALELVTMQEGGPEIFHQKPLLRGQLIWLLRQQGGKIAVLQWFWLARYQHGPGLLIDLVEIEPVLHVIFGVPTDDLPLELKANDGDCL